jgi:hypothetical protein
MEGWLLRHLGARAFHKGVEDSLRRLKRAAEVNVPHRETGKPEKGRS